MGEVGIHFSGFREIAQLLSSEVTRKCLIPVKLSHLILILSFFLILPLLKAQYIHLYSFSKMLPIIECLCERAGILAQTKLTLKVTPEWGVPSNEFICSLSCSTRVLFHQPPTNFIANSCHHSRNCFRSTNLLALCL